MAKEYRIYPGIGIARVGNSPDSFVLAPEVPDIGPLELRDDDSIVPVQSFKDANHKLRRQAARFRVYEVVTNATGAETFNEVTAANGVQIEWRVELANEKAAAGYFISETTPEDVTKPRNPDASQADLIIKPSFPQITGINQSVKASVEGKFKGTTVYLGELQTDGKGRLVVLGGRGTSASIPAGQPVGDNTQATGHMRNTFANNWGWYDDVADGPVTAVIKIAGQPDQPVARSAWVIVAPPDYAPYTNGITTLYDVATQAANIQAPATPSFMADILPIVKAAAGLRYVSSLTNWTDISTDYVTLSTKNNPAADKLRRDTLSLLLLIETSGALQNYHFTSNQKTVLNAWANGIFVSDYQAAPPPASITPAGLDRASLTQAVGGGFFPGIEAGIRMTAPAMYSSPYRITDKPFMFAGIQQNPHAGFITRTMACPWQSDFFECEMQTVTSAWWPAQRPIDVFVDPQAQNRKEWIRPLQSQQELVDKFWMLGLIKKNAVALYEQERDPSIPVA
jgi:hypothetical protein